jgi:hypothetical protein
MKIRHTVIVKDPVAFDLPLILVEFYRSGVYVESRHYGHNEWELLGRRISQWIQTGSLS